MGARDADAFPYGSEVVVKHWGRDAEVGDVFVHEHRLQRQEAVLAFVVVLRQVAHRRHQVAEDRRAQVTSQVCANSPEKN